MQTVNVRPSIRSSRKAKCCLVLAAAAATSLVTARSVSAQFTPVNNWIANGDGTWGVAANWSENAVPFATGSHADDVVFTGLNGDNSMPVNETITIATTAASAGRLNFKNPGVTTVTGPSFTSTGGLTLRGGIIVDATAGPVTISGTSAATMNLGGLNQSWINNSLNSVTMPPVSSPNAGNTATLTLDGTGLLGVTGTIANGTGSAVAVAKDGTGTWQIPNNNTYTGGFTLKNGTILIAGSTAFGTNSASANKKLTIQGGSVGGVDAADSTIPAAVPVFVNGNFGINTTASALRRVNFAGTVNLGGATRTVTVGIQGSDWVGAVNNGGLVKEGPGVLVLGSNVSAANALTGNLPVNAGGVVLGNPNAVANYLTGNVVLASGTYFGGRLGSDSSLSVAQLDAIRDNAVLFDAANKNFAIDVTLAGTTTGTVPNQVVTPIPYSGVIGNVNGNSRGFVKTSGGSLILTGTNTYTGGTTVVGGTLVAGNADAFAAGSVDVADRAIAQAQASLPKAVTVTTLTTNATGKFDLTNNSMVVKGMTDSAVRTQLQAGYNAGAWNGPTGIVSTSITPETSIGYATKLQTGITDFKGVTGMADTDVQVKFTYAGDANLDGKVDIGDLGLLAGAWQAASGKVWFDGDFTYDGAVDIGDLGLLSGNWQKGTAGNPNPPLMDFSTAMAQFSAFDGVVVPEPTSLGLLGVAGIGLLASRRRVQQN